jgi:DNA polymerase I-like protein with 3'-5' exonuclease and polymerase domains
MQRIANSTTRTQTFSRRRENSPETITRKLEHTRAEVRRAITDVQASEGRFLDYATADVIQRALVAADRNLQELTLQVAVLERKR